MHTPQPIYSSEHRDFLFKLLTQPSPSGWEAGGTAIWRQEAQKFADRVEQDPHGNTWATLTGRSDDAPVVMLEAHADEIGFIVKHVSEDGFVSISPVGGSDKTIAAARRIQIFTKKGVVPGVIGNTAIHLRNTDKDKLPDWKDLFVDIGVRSAEEAAELGIQVGCPAVYVDGTVEMGSNRLVGRALDNRVGGFLLVRILELLSTGERPKATVVAANAVQEELGSYGASMIAHRIAPDAAIVFDVTHATDTPGIDAREHGNIKLGAGPTVAHGMSNHPLIVEKLETLAEQDNLPLQHEAISRTTRTDNDAVFASQEGIPSALISFPLRYMHSPTETIDLNDLETAAKLVASFIRSLQPGEKFEPKGV